MLVPSPRTRVEAMSDTQILQKLHPVLASLPLPSNFHHLGVETSQVVRVLSREKLPLSSHAIRPHNVSGHHMKAVLALASRHTVPPHLTSLGDLAECVRGRQYPVLFFPVLLKGNPPTSLSLSLPFPHSLYLNKTSHLSSVCTECLSLIHRELHSPWLRPICRQDPSHAELLHLV